MSDLPSLEPNRPGRPGVASQLDNWAAEHPWHARLAPWGVYIVLLALIGQASLWQPWCYVPLKLAQAALVGYLAWRWRRLVPELTLHFHWSVLPVSCGLVVGWVWMQQWTVGLFPSLQAAEPTFLQSLDQDGRGLFWAAAVAHLVAMCTAVPIIEEVFNRSLLLRSLHDRQRTAAGLLQLLADLPLVGPLARRSEPVRRAAALPDVWGGSFSRVPLGRLSWFGVAASTALFAAVHPGRDWPAAVLCGIVWCLMLASTRRQGLGPVIWSHAIVNLLLWVYVVSRGAWSFI